MTFLYVLYSIPIQTVLGLLIAVLLKQIDWFGLGALGDVDALSDLQRHRGDDLVLHV